MERVSKRAPSLLGSCVAAFDALCGVGWAHMADVAWAGLGTRGRDPMRACMPGRGGGARKRGSNAQARLRGFALGSQHVRLGRMLACPAVLVSRWGALVGGRDRDMFGQCIMR